MFTGFPGCPTRRSSMVTTQHPMERSRGMIFMMHMQRSMTTRFATAAGLSVALTLGAAAAPGFGSIVHSHATGRSQVAATKVSSVRGIVVARDLLRHSLVVSSSVGLVRTVRLASERATRRVRVGSEVASRVVALGDGTFHARSLKTVG